MEAAGERPSVAELKLMAILFWIVVVVLALFVLGRAGECKAAPAPFDALAVVSVVYAPRLAGVEQCDGGPDEKTDEEEADEHREEPDDSDGGACISCGCVACSAACAGYAC